MSSAGRKAWATCHNRSLCALKKVSFALVSGVAGKGKGGVWTEGESVEGAGCMDRAQEWSGIGSMCAHHTLSLILGQICQNRSTQISASDLAGAGPSRHKRGLSQGKGTNVPFPWGACQNTGLKTTHIVDSGVCAGIAALAPGRLGLGCPIINYSKNPQHRQCLKRMEKHYRSMIIFQITSSFINCHLLWIQHKVFIIHIL